MAVTHAASAPTAEEQRQLKAFFEHTRTLPSLLSTLRSRRVARGYHIESCTQILDTRPDIDWMTRVPGCPNASLFGPYQYNINRPGTTWFLPICDVGWLYFSAMLNLFDAWHLYYVDDATQKPAGVEKWV